MISSQINQKTVVQSDSNIGRLLQFFFTEECGLALFQNKQTGKKFYMDKDCWNDLAADIRPVR